jgi:glycosyltransferase involved in cell wall biosynthesis
MHLICPASDLMEPYSREMGFSYTNVEITRTYSLFKDLKALIAISTYIKKNNIDILVGHTPKGALLAMVAGWLNKTPKRIYFRHGLVYETASGLNRKTLVLTEKITSRCSTQIICVSPSLFNLSIRDNLNPVSKQSILGKGTCGGIDTQNKFNPAKVDRERISFLRNKYCILKDDIVIGFCGRLVRDKGIVELVETLDLLRFRNTGKRFVLLLVGFLETRDRLPSGLIEKINTDKDIVLTGLIDRDIQNYYALMNIYILPSYREGFGMSNIEASSMELPVLTTKATGCIDSIIENFTGRYIENNPDSIAEGVEFYLNNPDLAFSYGKNGRDYVVKNFDNLLIWNELEKYYC